MLLSKVTLCLGGCTVRRDGEKVLCLLAEVSGRAHWSADEIEKGSRGISPFRRKVNAGNEYLDE